MSKPRFASLTAGLLARKGDAAPAAHTAALLSGLARAPIAEFPQHKPPVRRDCAAETAEAPVVSHDLLPAVAHETVIMRHHSDPPRIEPSPAATHSVAVHLSGARRTAVTVRLEERRYLRLKLSGARLHRTNQDILVKALDSYLNFLGIEDIESVTSNQ